MSLKMYLNSQYENVDNYGDLYQFFSEENYELNKIYFGVTSKEEASDRRSLMIGIGIRIGQYNDKALVFFEISADNYFDSLIVRREQGYAYYLIDEKSEDILISSGEKLKEEEEKLLLVNSEMLNRKMKQRVLYKAKSDFSGFTIVMYITGDSLQ